MENWYLPITILPGIGLLIISTSSLAISLNEEMEVLLQEVSTYEQILYKKLTQLRMLTFALMGLYLTTALLVLSGLVSVTQNFGLDSQNSWGLMILLVGVASLFISLVLLIIYSVRAVKIRQEHFSQCLLRDKQEDQ